jgi:isopentenyl-diphosphate delta-isomerase
VSREQLILVNPADESIGVEEKMAVHERGLLHRAFSVFLYNQKNELLLQQRAFHKYHSGGLWSNSCCGHPRPGEEVGAAAGRRLGEELGISCQLAPVGSFSYRVDFANGLIENELDHVFLGRYKGDIKPNPDEVSDWKWEAPDSLAARLQAAPSSFTHWFGLAFERFHLAKPSKILASLTSHNGQVIE